MHKIIIAVSALGLCFNLGWSEEDFSASLPLREEEMVFDFMEEMPLEDEAFAVFNLDSKKLDGNGQHEVKELTY